MKATNSVQFPIYIVAIPTDFNRQIPPKTVVVNKLLQNFEMCQPVVCLKYKGR